MSVDVGGPKEHGGQGLKKVADLVEIAGALRPLTAVMAGGERIEDLRLVESARDHGIIGRIVLIGQEKRIAAVVAKVGIDMPREDIVAAEGDEAAAAATVELIKAGAVEMVLKGSTPTHVLHRHMLPLAVRATVSLVSIFDAAPIAKGRPMIVTDAGVTTVCSFARIEGLIRNAVDVARNVMLIDRPRVALLSASEKPIPTLPSTQMGAEFAHRAWPDAAVYGPLAMDRAIDPVAAALKGLPGVPGACEVAGQADILVCPGIDGANVIYKIISALIKYGEASMANIIMGFPMPYVLLSRSDALETRLNSLALGAIYAQRHLGEQPPQTCAPAADVGCDSSHRDDEFVEEAEISGYEGIIRRNDSDTLSIHAAALKAAQAIGRPLEDIALVVAHLDAKITVAAMHHGRITDSNIAFLGGGPFTPKRAGQLPTAELIDLCYGGGFTRAELIEELTERGGLYSYLGEDRLDVIEERIAAGDAQARRIVDAMAYQIAKEIGAMCVAAGCDIEAIVLTGTLIRGARVRNELRRRAGRLAPILIFEEPLETEAGKRS